MSSASSSRAAEPEVAIDKWLSKLRRFVPKVTLGSIAEEDRLRLWFEVGTGPPDRVAAGIVKIWGENVKKEWIYARIMKGKRRRGIVERVLQKGDTKGGECMRGEERMILRRAIWKGVDYEKGIRRGVNVCEGKKGWFYEGRYGKGWMYAWWGEKDRWFKGKRGRGSMVGEGKLLGKRKFEGNRVRRGFILYLMLWDDSREDEGEEGELRDRGMRRGVYNIDKRVETRGRE
jgi:hypothetical protein